MFKFDKLTSDKAPTIWGLFFFTVAVLLIAVTVQKINTLPQSKDFIAPPPLIEHFTFGHSMIMADTLWVRALQDFDFCEKPISKNLCQGNDWLAKMLYTITNLDPYFYMVYSVGGIALSVLVSDVEGATKIFDKGVQVFPDRWMLLYRASYHAIYEEKNNAKAAELLQKAGRAGAPNWVYSLSAKFYTETGRREMAENMLKELESQNFDPSIIKRMKERLSEH